MDPFLIEESVDYGDMVTDAVVCMLATRGVSELTLRSVAGHLGVTPQAISYRLGDPRGARYRVIQLATVTFGARWTSWVDAALLEDVPLPALPATGAEIRGVRVWLSLGELARAEAAGGNQDLSGAIERVRTGERMATRRQLERWLGVRVPELEALRLCCLVDGLRAELAGPAPAIEPTDARDLLRAELDGLRSRTRAA